MKISLKYPSIFVFFMLSLEFPRDSKNEFELATVNKPSVFESLMFYYIFLRRNKKIYFLVKKASYLELCMVTYMRQSSVITLV